MKTIKNLVFFSLVALLASCTSTAKFPISSTVPGAEIVATKKQDRNNNYVIVLNAKNLADPGRLDPPKNNYIVWIVAESGTTNNVGQLVINNANKAQLTTSTPFNITEIIITAEDEGDLSYPRGTEISRTTFNK